ncbi:P-loop containing nucleoside triphosphate hydrolase protein [Cantharellus anzutake]|uniref:P-loop containing nucleoside triphosphate hydrolase protein n=1 Tax=Cantharellus anzutake TaxID=1750568 RepID=UPI001908B2B0|nr:P-loop containing nucleoside triphosphate hydrolase protein [Cantharellus anzutake]KAF8327271.1 P-loop containing nucleoside triphosphate hydrolase protein [Cantharellus anzutake]
MPPTPSLSYPHPYAEPTEDTIRRNVADVFGKTLCGFQLRAVVAQIHRRDLLLTSGTGSGKTLIYWVPLLYNGGRILVVITPLTVLGSQQATGLSALGVRSVCISKDNLSPDLLEDICHRKYRVIILSPELAMDHRFLEIWTLDSFSTWVDRVIVDECHVVSEWGSTFRESYKHLHTLRYIFPPSVTITAATATLPRCIKLEVIQNLGLSKNYVEVKRTNDRFNISLSVWKMRGAFRKYHDLNFLVTVGGPWMAFFDDRNHTLGAAKYIRSLLGQESKEKVVWFHSTMSADFRASAIQKLKSGTLIGICCTDAAGMGLDLPNIRLIVQYGVPDTLSTWAQRLRRGARDFSLFCSAILIAEPKWFGPETPVSTSSKTTQRVSEIKLREAMAMKEFITTSRCRRIILNRYFSNDDCDIEEFCCSRCAPHTPLSCCDNCSPGSSILQPPDEPTVLIRRAPLRAYERSEAEEQLEQQLLKWREEKLRGLFPDEADILPGSDILADEILTQIVDLAHFGRLPSIEALQFETRWTLSSRFGQEILALVTATHPQTVPSMKKEADLEELKARRPPTCSACNNPGHTKMQKICPQHPSHIQASVQSSLAQPPFPLAATSLSNSAQSLFRRPSSLFEHHLSFPTHSVPAKRAPEPVDSTDSHHAKRCGFIHATDAALSDSGLQFTWAQTFLHLLTMGNCQLGNSKAS